MSGSSITERLFADHAAIRTIAEAFGALLTPEAPSDITPIATCRWDLTKAILQHVAFEDRYAFLPLERDPRPHVAATAQRFKRELEAIQTSFEGHMDRWSSDATLRHWHEYRQVAVSQNRVLFDRMRREEAELFPYIIDNAEIAGGGSPPPAQRNWARSAWNVQDSLKRR
jgi:hypothetical protein